MIPRLLPFAAALLLAAPVAYAGVIRLIERNGDVITARELVQLRVPADGQAVVVPDAIFAGSFER